MGGAVRWQRWVWWLLVIAAIALALIGDGRFRDEGVLRAGVAFWAGSLAVLAAAAWFADRDDESPAHPWTSRQRLALLSVLGLALLTRLWRIGQYPPPDMFGFEEFQTGGVAYQVLRDHIFPLEFPFTNILPGLSFGLFGFSSYALRLPFILSGIAAPVLLFLAMRRLVALPAAWGAAALLASARWPAAAARFADEIFFPISIFALSFWLFVRLVQRRRQTSALLFAIASSGLFYAYSGYRSFPLIAYGGAALAALWAWRRRSLAPRIAGCFVMVTAIWVVLLGPGVVSDFYQGSELFSEPFYRHEEVRESGPAGDRSLFGRLHEAAWMMGHGAEVFVSKGDPIPTVNIPDAPMLDPITGGLCVLACLGALWRWRRPWRAGLLAAFALPFTAMAIVVTNLNVSRYFVLLIPLFALIGLFLDDLCGGRAAPQPATSRAIVVVVLLAVGLNVYDLQRLIDDPAVRASFLVPENTVLAAIHHAPAGARVILLTEDGSNAFEPSDYTWYTAHAHGGRPDSLSDALRIRPDDNGSLYWIAQGTAEGALLPDLVALVCPEAKSKTLPAPSPEATLTVAWASDPGRCRPPPAAGLTGVYRVENNDGSTRETRHIDPAIMAYTIPWQLDWQLESRQIRGLHITWAGELVPSRPGPYDLHLELRNASGSLRVGDASAAVPAAGVEWQMAELHQTLAAGGAPIRIDLDGQLGTPPRVRLFWKPAGGGLRLVPPTALRP